MDNYSGYLLALLTTSSLIYFLSTRAHFVGLIDKPTSRKVHDVATPTIGGIAIFGGFLLALLLSPISHVYLVAFVLPALPLVAIGLLDDVMPIAYRLRFVIQILAGLLMIFAGGVLIEHLGELVIPGKLLALGWLAIPFTLVCMVGMVNAFNMSDGIDGLTGSLTLVALLALAVVAAVGGQFAMVEGMAYLAFSLIAFLLFNARLPGRHRAHIFLGDCGSTLLGFAVMWFAVRLSQGGEPVMTPVTPLYFVAVPFFDMATLLIWRIRKKQSPFEADRNHLHHLFLAAGFSVSQTVTLITAMALVLAAVGIAGLYLGVPQSLMFALFLALCGGYFYATTRAWRRLQFLGRAICRRASQDRRSGQDRRHHAAGADPRAHEGADRRRGLERRVALAPRRTADDGRGTITPIGQRLCEGGAAAPAPQIIFVNRTFWPEPSVASQLLGDLASALAADGREVRVISAGMPGAAAKAEVPAAQTIRGVVVHSVQSAQPAGRSRLGRAVDGLRFHLRAALALWRVAARGDVVVAMSDPPMIGSSAAVVAYMRGAKLVLWHQELFPEASGMLARKRARAGLASALASLRNLTASAAAANVVLSRNMAQRLMAGGTPAQHIQIIPNWSAADAAHAKPAYAHPLRAEWGLNKRFVVGYSGKLAQREALHTLLEAAERLRGDANVVFLVGGDGDCGSWLAAEAHRRGLSNVLCWPYQAQQQPADSLGVPDVHVASLRGDMDGVALPENLYAILAAGRPMVFVGAEQGDVARILRNWQCGLAVGERDAQALVTGLRQLQADPAQRQRMGSQARALFEQHYHLERALLSWSQLLAALLEGADSKASESALDYEHQNELADARRQA